MTEQLCDAHGRRITYMRVSITEKCNLACLYCGSRDCSSGTTNSKRLSHSVMTRIIRAATEIGVHKIRLTGGEPLCADDVIKRCSEISSIHGVKELSMTTNGILLAEKAEQLYDAGIQRFNISLDAVSATTYTRITGHDFLRKVIEGIRAAVRVCDDVRINVVLLKGINDTAPEEFIAFARDEGVTVRFLELMPTANGCTHTLFTPVRTVINKLHMSHTLLPEKTAHYGDTAQWYRLESGQRIGFIAPVSSPFCATCSRMRLTAAGDIIPCLHNTEKISLRDVTESTPVNTIQDALRSAAAIKPHRHSIDSQYASSCCMQVCGG